MRHWACFDKDKENLRTVNALQSLNSIQNVIKPLKVGLNDPCPAEAEKSIRNAVGNRGSGIMLIQCTKKLLDELKIKPDSVKYEKPLFCWHANLIMINRRKTVVLMNDSNLYRIVLHGLKAKDFKSLDLLIVKAICNTLMDECITADIVGQFINGSPTVIYAKTKDKATVARLNKACDDVHFFGRQIETSTIIQSHVSRLASNSLAGIGANEYIRPNEALYKDLETFSGKKIFSCQAVELKVTLDLRNYNVWRKVIVPYNITFKELHNVLQVVFDWRDYHLHDYYLFDGERPIVNLVCSDDAFEYPGDAPMIEEKNIKLSEYIPKYSRIKYCYDFGDNWEHYITVEGMLEDYKHNYPVCIAGEGNTPPEDVGGESGYDEFIEAISDPKHPEHIAMLNWSKIQLYEDFSIDSVNRRLKSVLRWL